MHCYQGYLLYINVLAQLAHQLVFIPKNTTPDANPNLQINTDVKKPRHYCRGFLVYGRGYVYSNAQYARMFGMANLLLCQLRPHLINYNNADVKKPRHCCRGFLVYGKGYDTRTPNTR